MTCLDGLSTCSTTVTTTPQLTSPVAVTGAPVPSTNATVTTRICDRGSDAAHRACMVTTTNITWSPDPEGGATQSSTVGSCIGPDAPGSCITSPGGEPTQIAMQCGTTATSCARTVACLVLADMSGAKCTVGLSAGYAVFCTSPQGADPSSSSCQSVVNFSCANPPGALPANCSAPQYVPPKSDSQVLEVTGVELGRGGGSNGGGGGGAGGGPVIPATETSPSSVNVSPGSSALPLPAGTVSAAPSSSRIALVVAVVPRGAPAATVGLTASANRSVTGRHVRLVATVTPVPSGGGTVRFLAAGKTIPGCGAVAVNATTGEAVCVTTFPVAGRIPVVAVYSSRAGAAGIRSRVLNVVVSWSLRLTGAPSQTSQGGRAATVSTLACATNSGGCRASVVLVAAGSVVGRADVSVAPARARAVKVPLSAAAQKQLAATRRMPVRERVLVTAVGRQHVVATANLTLTA